MTSVSDILSRPAEEFGNDSELELAWVLKATQHMEIYFNLITSVDPSLLKLTRHDDEIYSKFRQQFTELNLRNLNTDSLKSSEAKEKWRTFCEEFKHVDDYNFGTILRLDSEGEYSDSNSIFVPRIQFYAIEIARNREGHNNSLRNKFNPTIEVKSLIKENKSDSSPLGATLAALTIELSKKSLNYSVKIENGMSHRGDLSLHLKIIPAKGVVDSVTNFLLESKFPLPFSRCTKGGKDPNNLLYSKIEIQLNRSITYKISLKAVNRLTDFYGCKEENSEIAWVISQPQDKDQLRKNFLSQHLQALLKANGYSVISTKDQETDSENLDLELPSCPNCHVNFETLNMQTFKKLPLSSDDEFRINFEGLKLYSNINLPKISSCIIKKCQEFTNFYKITVRLFHMSDCMETKRPKVVYHVTSNSNSHNTQKIASLWSVIEPTITHVIFVYGPVVYQGVDPEMEHIQSLKLDSVQKVMTEKYGIQILNDPEWMDRINVLAKTALRFECLSVNPLSQVQIGCDPRAGCFIQYNCSRLNALFQRYNEEIDKGTIKKTSDEKIDFSLLKKDEEWYLLFRYVLLFPIIVEESVDFKNQKMPLHRICVLLQQLSKDFSQYYSRVKLFTPFSMRNPDLLHARIHLLKAVYQVFKNSLKLIQLNPLITM